jgi:hypothetical protein
LEFVALGSISRDFEFGDKPDIDRILSGFRELKLVLPFESVEARVRSFALVLEIEPGEPPGVAP